MVSVANALTWISVKTTVKQIASLSLLSGARVSGGTNMRMLLKAASAKYGLTFSVSDEIGTSFPLIANCGGNGMFSTWGHYVAVYGRFGKKLLIADSGWYKGKYSKASRKAVTDLGNGLLLASPDVLDKDCEGRSPKYYIIKTVPGG